VTGADSLTIEGIGRVAGAGVTVTPTASTAYALVAYNRGGSATELTTVDVGYPSATSPPSPANARALGTVGGAVVLWDPVPMASSYRLEASTQSQPAFTTIATPSATHPYVVHGGGVANSINSYRVYAVNAVGESLPVQASALVVPPPPEGPSLAIVPSSATVARGDSLQFAVQPASTVTWLLASGAFGGRISSSGRYTAPATPGNYVVVATGSIAASASVIVP
jgi:hypothetical protein